MIFYALIFDVVGAVVAVPVMAMCLAGIVAVAARITSLAKGSRK